MILARQNRRKVKRAGFTYAACTTCYRMTCIITEIVTKNLITRECISLNNYFNKKEICLYDMQTCHIYVQYIYIKKKEERANHMFKLHLEIIAYKLIIILSHVSQLAG